MNRLDKKAYILGAGPIGLISAWQLLENGWVVDIYEKAGQVGGMCRTWKWGDFLVDAGPHIFHTPDSELARFWEQEFGDLFVKGEFWCKNVKGTNFDEFYDYPLSWESLSRYPKELKEQILHELKTRDPDQKAQAKNYADYMEAEVGPTLKKMFFEKYPQKIWGIPTEEMASEWAPKRIEFRQKTTPFYHQQWNAVGRFGTGCIFERIREHILKLGGRIHLETEVLGLETSGSRIKEVRLSGQPAVVLNPEDMLISSLPISQLAAFIGYQSDLSFRGVCLVNLVYDRKTVLPEGLHWLYYDSEQVYFNRVSEQKKLAPETAPEDKTYITAEITYSPGDRIDRMDRDQLLRDVAEQVEQVGLASRQDLLDCDLLKEPYVYPLQSAGYQAELARTRSAISRFEQLYSLGTGGDFAYSDLQVLFHKAFDTVAILCGKDSSSAQTLRQTPRCKLNQTVAIGGRKIGPGEPPYIIAEIGLNHNGRVSLAKKLLDSAQQTGCDAVKIQSYQAGSRVSNKVKGARYAETITGLEETPSEMFDRLALSFEEQKEVFAYARTLGLEVFSTPFDFASVDFLESLNVGVYKIASMDLVNLPLIAYVAKTGKPLILSTGMSTLGQIEEAVDVVTRAGNPNLILLHCNSSYPAAPEEMNLRSIETLQSAFKVPVGLSDHTFDLFVSHTAIVLGADVIERHFTLDRAMEGPDHILSSEPAEMAELVRIAHKVPTILGDGVKRIQPNEYDTLNSQRKSLYAACNIKQGEIINRDDIVIKGPGGGLLPRYLEIVVGRKAQQAVDSDCPITWDDI